MKQAILRLAVLLLVFLTVRAPAADANDAFIVNKRLGRGVNILGWDPIWRDKAQGHLTDEHFKLIAQAGFNHVRINLHPLRDGKPDAEGKLREQFYAIMDWAIDQALANKLMVVLDYHDDLAISPNPAGKRKDFMASWAAIAEHCKARPPEVLFEILNEPAPKFTHELWREFFTEVLEVIRRTNPTRMVIIGPNMWNGIGQVDKLVLPANDRNLIATVHYYSPMEFTHQGASWTNQRDKTGLTWTATAAQQQAVERDFDKAQNWAAEQKRPIYLGEFGAYDKADMQSRARYISFVARQAEKRNWSWAHWQFDNDFKTYDVPNHHWFEPILEALIPPQGK